MVHGYDIVDDAVVWDIIQNHLPLLVKRIDEASAPKTDGEETEG
ncbi:MAG: DUF86 domain-containing protein [Planctomycetia bacterium]|nr:DUF86 domain-containing protein [Planctomycetia bacterium]